jgi:YbbR domain-containing protein
MREFLRRAFLDNALVKLVAFVLALTLFLLVRGERETERSFRVAVAYLRPEGRILVSEVPESVEVRVRGPWTRVTRLDAADVGPIVLDLAKHEDGDLTLNETVLRLPQGMTVASIRPPKITLHFEHRKRVPVTPVTTGAPAEGWVVQRIDLEPRAVMLKGTRAELDPIAEVRSTPIPLAGKRGTFREDVTLAGLPDGVERADTGTLTAEVVISVEETVRRLGDVPVLVRPPPGQTQLDLVSLEPPRVEILLRGDYDVVSQIPASSVFGTVELRPGDFQVGAKRQGLVQVEGVPAGVATEVRPRDVQVVYKPH